MKKFLSVILAATLLITLTACRNEKNTTPQTTDMKEMVVGSELPFLLYANKDYCIMNMGPGGVIVYDFTTQEIANRITPEQLASVGFSHSVSSVSKDGLTIYFQEHKIISNELNTHSYNLKKTKLKKVNDNIEISFHYKNIFESNETKALLFDDFAYGTTFILLDDLFVVSRLKQGGSLLSDTEIVFMNKSLQPEQIFTLFEE